MALKKREGVVELGDQLSRTLDARIMEIVSIKQQQEEITRAVLKPADIANFYKEGWCVLGSIIIHA